MWFYPPLQTPGQIPGTNISFQYVIDFRVERWGDKKTYGELSFHLTHEGLVGQTTGGKDVFFHVTRGGDAVVREATPEESARLFRMPPVWEKHVRTDLDVIQKE